MKKMRIAVIGCGAICPSHIRAIKSSENEICALCDIIPEAATAISERFELQDVAIYTDYIEMLEKEKPDVVHICTPHYLHAKMCVEALGRNINVLCEKPVCISLDEIETIRKAQNNSTAKLGVSFQNRYEPAFIKLKELVEKEGLKSAFGSVVWKRGADYYNSAEWRGTWKYEGGGVMINQAIHTLDMLMWLCGMPESVIAHVSTDTLGEVIEVEDTASARFECDGDKAFHFYATNTALTTFPARVDVKLTSGSIASATAKLLIVDDKVEFIKEERVDGGKAVWGSGHTSLTKHFYECIENGSRFPIDLDEASKAIRMIAAMYASKGQKADIK